MGGYVWEGGEGRGSWAQQVAWISMISLRFLERLVCGVVDVPGVKDLFIKVTLTTGRVELSGMEWELQAVKRPA